MSLSSGLPGLSRRSMPSSPAISIAENARYPLHAGSGNRTSIRFALGDGEYIGIRTAAERLRLEYAGVVGAAKTGTRRGYEFGGGAVPGGGARGGDGGGGGEGGGRRAGGGVAGSRRCSPCRARSSRRTCHRRTAACPLSRWTGGRACPSRCRRRSASA